MQDAVHHLLPAIPSVLYAGLGRPQVERLIALRKAAARCWERHASTRPPSVDFATLFQDVLALFETEPQVFHVQRVQDELLGKLSNVLQVPYGTLTLEIVNEAIQQGTWAQATQGSFPDSNAPVPELKAAEPPAPTTRIGSASPPTARPDLSKTGAPITDAESLPPRGLAEDTAHRGPSSASTEEVGKAHITSAGTTEPLHPDALSTTAISGADLPEEAHGLRADFEESIGRRSVSDVWYIEPELDASDHLRTRIAQLATEIAEEAALAECIECTSEGVGFICASEAARNLPTAASSFQGAVLALLNAVSAPYTGTRRSAMEGVGAVDDISLLLQGAPPSRHARPLADRLSDAGILKYFRLTRLARRLLELEWSALQIEGETGQ
jgi:hypothetical protein